MLDVYAILSARYAILTREHHRVVCTWRKGLRAPLSVLSVTGEAQVAQKLHRDSRARRCAPIACANGNNKVTAMREDRPTSATSRRPAGSDTTTVPVYENLADACSSGLPDVDTCTLDFSEENDSDYIARSAHVPKVNKQSATPSDPDLVLSEAWNRGRWLLGLLILQSASSVILVRCASLWPCTVLLKVLLE